jgi:hypothetical protein
MPFSDSAQSFVVCMMKPRLLSGKGKGVSSLAALTERNASIAQDTNLRE